MKGRVTLPMLEPRACDDLRFSNIYYPYNMLSYFVCIFEKSEHNSLACLKIVGGFRCAVQLLFSLVLLTSSLDEN